MCRLSYQALRYLGLLACFMLASCASIPQYPVGAEVFDENLETSVDSSIAQYYLERYLQGKNTDPLLQSRIDALYRGQQGTVPTRHELKVIAEEYSVDFAALFYADHLSMQAENRAIQEKFNRFLKHGDLVNTAQDSSKSRYIVLFFPGWDYVESGHVTGADFAVPRRLISAYGVENYLVNISPHGSVEENAAMLAKAIERFAQSGKTIVLVGASSAGPAIYLSLAENNKNPLFDNVGAWVNLGGILMGSPVLDYYQQWPQRWFFNLAVWFKGWDRDSILSMSSKQSLKRIEGVSGIDRDILIINYIGLSLSGSLSPYTEKRYSILKSEGPNDGLAYLPDMVAPSGLTIVAPNSDHFFMEDPKINQKTIALMKVVIEYLEKMSPGGRHPASQDTGLRNASLCCALRAGLGLLWDSGDGILSCNC